MKPKNVSAKGLFHPADDHERVVRPNLRAKIERVLISSTAIREQTRRIARAIAHDAQKEKSGEIHLVIVLKGATIFGAMLAQYIFECKGPPVRLDFIRASSYGQNTTSSENVKIDGHLSKIKGRHVVIVEDIADTGLTLCRLKAHLTRERGAKSVQICVLLNKPSRRLPELQKKLHMDYIGFNIPNMFVVGMGLDCAEQFRELPFVAVAKT